MDINIKIDVRAEVMIKSPSYIKLTIRGKQRSLRFTNKS